MSNEFIVKIVKNKNNGQLNCSLPKRQLSKEFLKEFDKVGTANVKIKMEKWF